jgi:hypothetical protein
VSSTSANEIGQVFQEAKWTVTFNKTSPNEFRGYVMAFVGIDTVAPETEAIVNSLAGIKVAGRKIDLKSVSGLSQARVAVFIGRPWETLISRPPSPQFYAPRWLSSYRRGTERTAPRKATDRKRNELGSAFRSRVLSIVKPDLNAR